MPATCDMMMSMTKLGTAIGTVQTQLRCVNGDSHPADSLAALPATEQVRILLLLDRQSQDREVSMLLAKARDGLDAAEATGDITALVHSKDLVHTIQKIARQLQLYDLQQQAMELTRRGERKIGVAIRNAQKRGDVATATHIRGRRRIQDFVPKKDMSGDQGHNGIAALTDGVTDEEFEEILTQARREGRLSRTHVANLCRAKSRSYNAATTLSAQQLIQLVQVMPPRLHLLILLSAWCKLKFGELQELRRGDIDVDAQLIRIRRIVLSRTNFTVVTLKPNTRSAPRDVQVPDALMATLRGHLVNHVKPDDDALLFTSGQGAHLAISSFQTQYYRARRAIGLPNLRFDDLKFIEGLETTALPVELTRQQAPLPKGTPRKTVGARKVIVDLMVTLNGLAWAANDTDPEEVDLDNHREDISDIEKSLKVITKFLTKVKEQDK